MHQREVDAHAGSRLALAALQALAASTHLYLQPRSTGAPTDDATAHAAGHIVEDSGGNLWLCTVAGTPGSWRSIVGRSTSGGFLPWKAPVRVYDSRVGTTPSTGPKTKLNGTRIINLFSNGGVGPYATGALVNILLVNATTGNGNFTVWGNGVAKPQANTLVWGGNAGRFSTLAFTNVDKQGRIQVNSSLDTDIVIDVVGQYV